MEIDSTQLFQKLREISVDADESANTSKRFVERTTRATRAILSIALLMTLPLSAVGLQPSHQVSSLCKETLKMLLKKAFAEEMLAELIVLYHRRLRQETPQLSIFLEFLFAELIPLFFSVYIWMKLQRFWFRLRGIKISDK
jgi:hypothetical protein